jgi:hypothetical protein
MGSVQLRRVGGLATALTILTALTGVMTLLSAVVAGLALDEAEDFLAGRISEDDFLTAYAPSVLLGVAQSATFLGAVVLTMLWMQRIAANHRTIGRVGRWSPGWAIGGWFLPPLYLYLIPFLVLREMWRASDPDVPLDDDRWKQGGVSPVLPVWWVLYGLVPLALLVVSIVQGSSMIAGGGFTGDSTDLAELIDEQYPLTLTSGVVTLAAAVAWVLLVRGLTARHRRLTGEDVSRA